MKIKEVEELVGITKKNIRFYEQENLLSPQRNSENGYREYNDADVCELMRIKLLRKLDMPIEEIRILKQGERSLHAAMKDHLSRLEAEVENINHAMDLCRQLYEGDACFDTLDVPMYLDKMTHMEQKGVTFVNIQKKDAKTKYFAPIVISLLTALLFAVLIAVLFIMPDRPPTALLVVAVVALVGSMACAIGAGIQRVREIRGGEEDAASKY